MRRRTVVSLALVLVACVAPTRTAAAAEYRTWKSSRVYVTGDIGPTTWAASCGRGMACFGAVGADEVSLRIVDRSARRVGGLVAFGGLGHDRTHAFCGGGSFAMLPGESVTVILDGAGDVRGAHVGPDLWRWGRAPGCAELRAARGVATTRGATRGRVDASFVQGGAVRVAAEEQPVREGTILVAARPTYGLGPVPGCAGAPDCLAWLQVCRRPVPRNNGVTASIVDVRRLAASPKERRFHVEGGQGGLALNWGVTVEFWSSSCRAVEVPDHDLSHVSATRFAIPSGATWMTVTSPCEWICTSFSGVALHWTLT